jgi:hypothetical protein
MGQRTPRKPPLLGLLPAYTFFIWGLPKRLLFLAFTKGNAVKVRDLERFLAGNGVDAAKIDAITRKLRDSGRLPKGGRGVHAPQIGARETAIILVAVAGCSKGLEADARMEKLEGLRSKSGKGAGTPLVEAIEALLLDRTRLKKVTSVRVGRTARQATIYFRDKTVEEFLPARPRDQEGRFWVEGVLPGSLLELVASAVAPDSNAGIQVAADDRSEAQGERQ